MVGFNFLGISGISPQLSCLYCFCGFVAMIMEGRSNSEFQLKKLDMSSFRIPKGFFFSKNNPVVCTVIHSGSQFFNHFLMPKDKVINFPGGSAVIWGNHSCNAVNLSLAINHHSGS